eukprot:36030-Eustigmatos_ZCMA.PRE.1
MCTHRRVRAALTDGMPEQQRHIPGFCDQPVVRIGGPGHLALIQQTRGLLCLIREVPCHTVQRRGVIGPWEV